MNEADAKKKTTWTVPGPNEPLFIAASPAMQEIKTLAARASGGDAKVLITGESGVGKDVVARFIHARSNRSPRPFVAVNCAAFSETLLESELFGHVRGSFTGAHRDKIGKLQQAHKGTVFLDEVGEMSLRMQALLLRFLESGEIQPVGADGGGTKVDVRVIAARFPVIALVVHLSANGTAGGLSTLGGWALGLALFLPMFALGGMGAGDVKLLAAFGAWLGPWNVVETAIAAGVAGGVLALGLALSRNYMSQALSNMWSLLMFWREAGLRPHPTLTLDSHHGPRLAYAIPISVGAIVAIWLQ